ncbi:Ubiquinol-cytochrome c reductase iron-sulfur subunit [Roseomonas mucosa]|uniref:Ubiquinol-cytochrome c reductase iron-sulfur subunit n=1 Tax=Roseomonas mucosa TaxID=207340 RepID=A0A379MXU0_9PROT|nr:MULTISPECIES: ubiquinol-cytochrome c reductase iron-sulfur subunit [Roseomonas]MCG7352082.1 ubiquinol-cytochrome c reductase iron-sulfur subunit [Roseomonas mucosa]MCG7357891.1 ubiquinol-cytochrome c reductase iron-sulfur subunit [Roseomonas mucosa]MDT8290184.1 ubiquinol-cytochrome c reductase iron-sulfur subunit [Roseomonas mucosa]MDT8294747.1 ubiquinol-cytochrome c reductase iron-sulfur subunit [Roseomonas mucosa]MDT8315824.1 ubiquinol-cytochrome c reductase iron-sulfur subunit [Roseomona
MAEQMATAGVSGSIPGLTGSGKTQSERPGLPPQGGASHGHATGRRDFLTLVTGSFALVGAGAIAWPFINSMNPAADTLALSTTDVDLGPVAAGQAITVVWRGKPVFIRHRTPEEVKAAVDTPMSALKDPATDQSRTKPGKEPWLVVVGICTHLGCVPLGQKPTDERGAYGGWFCPCHGSVYDTAGRIRQGPAPTNLVVPPYAFTNDTRIRIG